MHPAYNASQAAVHHQVTTSLAAEWAPYNVRVNALAPGYAKTAIAPVDHPDFRQHWIEDTPMQRYALPEEVGPTLGYLASDASRVMTGSVLVIDGGYTLWWLGLEANGEGSRQTTLIRAAPVRDDHAFVFEAFQRSNRRLLGETGAPIEQAAIDPLDSVADLVQRDGVGLLFEAERAAHDIGQDLEFGARQVCHDVIQQRIREQGAVQGVQAIEAVVVRTTIVRLPHHSPPLPRCLLASSALLSARS
jgi:hypothetical protein